MLKQMSCLLLTICIMIACCGCGKASGEVRLGVSFGVGNAARWEKEKTYMEEAAQKLEASIEVRINRTDQPKTQAEDCREMIDSGIDVLILTPRDVYAVGDILAYAKEKKVKVISYARAIPGEQESMFVGFDASQIGQCMGKYLTETVDHGDYIILKGDEYDFNTPLIYDGAMQYIEPLKAEGINVLLDACVPGYSVEEAGNMVKEAILQNNGRVDAILAPNDSLAGACRAVLDELKIDTPVAITGTDAELEAVKRIAAGRQDMTVYLDLRTLAERAVEEACNLAKGRKVVNNGEMANTNGTSTGAYLISGKTITRGNLDRTLIDTGYYTKEEVYGK